ncbi:hypothetical protein BN180_2870011 [Clostridioides difficile E14]|nr:hypothetical protein BN180_2870011 [Clostridioides difficile E14]
MFGAKVMTKVISFFARPYALIITRVANIRKTRVLENQNHNKI